jgi:hypothetical protein
MLHTEVNLDKYPVLNPNPYNMTNIKSHEVF